MPSKDTNIVTNILIKTKTQVVMIGAFTIIFPTMQQVELLLTAQTEHQGLGMKLAE